MELVYAALLLAEVDAELNEENLTSVLEAAGQPVTESRVRALVAALEGVDVDGVRTPDVAEIGRETATAETGQDAAPEETATAETGEDAAPEETATAETGEDAAPEDDRTADSDDEGV